jgi:hypothetical protein
MAKNLRAAIAYGQDLGSEGLTQRESKFATPLRKDDRAFGLWKARFDVTVNKVIEPFLLRVGIAAVVSGIA